MNIRHLRFFYDSARLSSMSKAAQQNYVGQPAISKAIKNLEEELGVKLIQHQNNRFNLTDEGINAYKNSQSVFNSLAKFKDSLTQKPKISGELNFACQSSMAESAFLPEGIFALTKKYPELKPVLSLGRTDLVKSWLDDGTVDFAIVINNRDFKGLHVRPISTGNFRLVRSNVYKGNWKKEGILSTEATRELGQLQQKFLSINKAALKSKMVVRSWGVIKSFVLQGFGVGFVPDYLVSREIQSGRLKYVEKQKYSIAYEVILIISKNKYISTKLEAVIRQFQCKL